MPLCREKTGPLRKQLTEAFSWCKGPVLTRLTQETDIKGKQINLWRRRWHPTPVLLPGESQGWGSLIGFHLWDRTESDTTEAT